MKHVLVSFCLALAAVFAPTTPYRVDACDEDGELYPIDGNSGRYNRSACGPCGGRGYAATSIVGVRFSRVMGYSTDVRSPERGISDKTGIAGSSELRWVTRAQLIARWGPH